MTEIFEKYKGDKNVIQTIGNIRESTKECYDILKSHHLRFKILTDSTVKSLRSEIQSLDAKLDILTSGEHSRKKSSFETMRELDTSTKLYMKNRKLIDLQKEDMQGRKFSGVDHDLDEIYEYLDFVGHNKPNVSFYLPKGAPFSKFRDFVNAKGKELQITSSKMVASKLFKEPPKMTSESTQVDLVEDFQSEVDRLLLEMEEMRKEIDSRDIQIDKLKYEIHRITEGNYLEIISILENCNLKVKSQNLTIEVGKLKYTIEQHEHSIQLKDKIIKSYEGEIIFVLATMF